MQTYMRTYFIIIMIDKYYILFILTDKYFYITETKMLEFMYTK